MRRVHVLVSGRVQGVFFRTSCARFAEELGLAGSVRNVPGGAVEAVFEGPDDAIDEIVSWCRSGPPLAVVEQIEVTEEATTGGSGFRITH